MSMKMVPEFRHFETLHCVTGSMRHVYAWAGRDTSEELLLGLGEGVGFAYFRFKGQAPFLGGRAQPKPSMEAIASSRMGVVCESKVSSSDASAEKSLLKELDEGRPVMLQVDMGMLPYFDFGQEYHFGGHVIVACGRDEESGDILVADREGELHPVPASALAAARGSRFKPFPPGRASWRFDFSGYRKPTTAELLAAMAAQAKLMLEPPITNIGGKGVRKAATECLTWPTLLEAGMLAPTLFNLYIFIDAKGGTGGGMFRYMFGRFLSEAATLGAPKAAGALASDFHALGDAWEDAGRLCLAATEGSGMDAKAATAALPELSRLLSRAADLEQEAWSNLARALPH
jgi:hypothetical protein